MKKLFIIGMVLMSVVPAYAQTVTLEEYPAVEIVLTPEAPIAGTNTEVNMTFKDPDTGILYDRANVALSLENMRTSQPVFGTTFYSLSGNVFFKYGFTKGGEYRLVSEVSPTEFTVNEFEPFTNEIIIGVAKGPSAIGAWVKIVFLFLIVGVIGYLFGNKRRFIRK